MKLLSYVLGLSLAVTAGVAPTTAQQVYFNDTSVTNVCKEVIQLNGDWDKDIGFGQKKYIKNLAVTEVTIQFVEGSYKPTKDLQANPGSECSFGPCKDSSIQLSCREHLGPVITVDFARRNGRRN